MIELETFFQPETLVALLIVGPILLAAVPLVLAKAFDRSGWLVALVSCLLLFVASLRVGYEVYVTGRESQTSVVHEVGGYPAPYGIELVADEFSILMALLVTATALGVLAYTRVGGPRGSTFYAGYLLLTGGLLGLTFTGDVFNMFVFLEIVGLATYALIARGDSAESAVAALKYLILGTLGASLYLLGVGLLFMATGHLNMGVLGGDLPDAEAQPLVRASFAFVFVGFAIKVAQWPLHTWQPDAYQRAPDGVTPLIAALVSTVSAYAMGRIFFTVYGPEFLQETPFVQEIVITVGAASVIAGSTLAVRQRDIKRMLAYSSVSQFGLIVAAYGIVTELALVGAVVHLFGHGLMKAGLFLAVGVVAVATGARRLHEYAGLFGKRPVAASAIAVLGIALIGIPPSIGFIGKWYIAVGAVQASQWAIAVVIFLSTMLTLAYVARLLELMYFTPPEAIETAGPTGVAAKPARPVEADGGRPIDEDEGEQPVGGSDVEADDGSDAQPVDGSDVEADDGSDAQPDTEPVGGEVGPRVSVGMVAIVVTIAVLAVALGFAGEVFQELLNPFVEEVFADG